MTLRVGLFGCGRIAGFFHGPILARLPGVEVTALVDTDPANRKRMAAILPGATLFADWTRPMALGEIDAAVICLPPALHCPAAIAALEAGCHVYVEKPLALTPEEAARMIAARDAAGRVGMSGLNFRFHPLYLDAKRRIEAGELGRVRAVQTVFTSAARALPGWKAETGAGGDALTDLATHHLDLVPFLAGSPVSPGTLSVQQAGGADGRDTGGGGTGGGGTMAAIAARLESGVPLSMIVGQTSGLGSNRVEILGERGHLTVDLSRRAPGPLATPQDAGATARLRRAIAGLLPGSLRGPGQDPSFELALRAFVEAAARGGPSPAPTFEDGARVVALLAEVRHELGAAASSTPVEDAA